MGGMSYHNWLAVGELRKTINVVVKEEVKAGGSSTRT